MNVREYSPENNETKKASESSRLHRKVSSTNMKLPINSVDLQRKLENKTVQLGNNPNLRVCRHFERSIQPSIVSKDKKGYNIPLPGDGKYADMIKANRYIREQEIAYLTGPMLKQSSMKLIMTSNKSINKCPSKFETVKSRIFS